MFLKHRQIEKGVRGNLFHCKPYRMESRGNAVFLFGFFILFSGLAFGEWSTGDKNNLEYCRQYLSTIKSSVNDTFDLFFNFTYDDVPVIKSHLSKLNNIDYEIVNNIRPAVLEKKQILQNLLNKASEIYDVDSDQLTKLTSISSLMGGEKGLSALYDLLDSRLSSSGSESDLSNIETELIAIKTILTDSLTGSNGNLYSLLLSLNDKITPNLTKSDLSEIENHLSNISKNIIKLEDIKSIDESLKSQLSELEKFYSSTYGQYGKSIPLPKTLYNLINDFYSDVHSVTNSIVSSAKYLESIYSDVHAITNDIIDISDNIYLLSDAVQVGEEEGTSYILVSNLAQNITSPIDLSIITNAILGSAFVSPFSADYNSYYDLLEDYKSGEIDSQTFIAEMGLYNWFAGLNFGDWYVTTPDDEDMENFNRWGIVENAKSLWSPLAESTGFPPYETSDARYFLYGTRDLTDNSTNLVYISDVAYNTASNAFYLSRINNNTLSNSYYLSRTYQVAVSNMNLVSSIYNILKDWKEEEDLPSDSNLDEDIPTFEENPEDIEEENTQVTEILNSSIDESALDSSLSVINRAQSAFNYSVGGSASPLVIKADVGVLGGSVPIELTIDQLQRFSSFWQTIVAFLTAGFKIATMLVVTRATIKTFLSDMKEIELW